MVAAFKSLDRSLTPAGPLGGFIMLPWSHDCGLVPPDRPPNFTPTYFTREATLYQLRVWSEWEWFSIPEASKPKALYIAGLGWVGGEMTAVLN